MKRLITIVAGSLLVLAGGSALVLRGSDLERHSDSDALVSGQVDTAEQQASLPAVQTNDTGAAQDSTAATVGGYTVQSSDGQGNAPSDPEGVDQAPPVEPPAPVSLVEKHLELRDNIANPNKLDAICVQRFSDGGVTEVYVGGTFKDNNGVTVQFDC